MASALNAVSQIYSFNEHKHRYAIWTAARAVQRSFVTTEVISEAIRKSLLPGFVLLDQHHSQHEFDELHRIICNQVLNNFSEGPITYRHGCSAKIIAFVT